MIMQESIFQIPGCLSESTCVPFDFTNFEYIWIEAKLATLSP